MSEVQLLAGAAPAIELLLRATFLIGTAWAAAACLGRAGASAAARHAAWLLGIAALLALPLLWWSVPSLRLPILPADAAAPIPAWSTPLPRAASSSLALPFMPRSGPPADAAAAWLLAGAYALGAGALLLRVIVGRRTLARLWRDSEAARDPDWEILLARLASELALSRPVALRISRAPVLPMTWGTLAPRLLLPAEALAWPAHRRRLVLLHELAHVARRDSLSRSIASLACALYWFHPGVWLAARRMRIEQEHAADDRVLAAGESARDYARNLLQLAKELGDRARPAQVPSIAGTGGLEQRLVSITSVSRRDRPGSAFLAASALIAFLATAFVAAGVPVGPPSLSAFQPMPFAKASPGGKGVNSGLADARPADGMRVAARSATLPERASGANAARAVARAPLAEGATRPVEPDRAGDGNPPPDAIASAGAIPDYGWQLERRDPQEAWRNRLKGLAAMNGPGSAATQSAFFRPAGPAAPAPAKAEAGKRGDGARSSRLVPRIILTEAPSQSGAAAPPAGSVMLSWILTSGKRP